MLPTLVWRRERTREHWEWHWPQGVAGRLSQEVEVELWQWRWGVEPGWKLELNRDRIIEGMADYSGTAHWSAPEHTEYALEHENNLPADL